jgi:methionyl-tRNA formyltransferase
MRAYLLVPRSPPRLFSAKDAAMPAGERFQCGDARMPPRASMSFRVAFFGSDAFSVHALRKLVQWQATEASPLLSIDVITRSVKPQGRKKVLIDLPLGQFISQTEPLIALHRADTKQEILALGHRLQPNLAVAVSYGKLIPHEFLALLTYGGLNVHPSFLPQYSGSSPIQYALLNDDLSTGVSVQTLHPTKFDKGDILLQSPRVVIEDNDNYASLVSKIGPIGGDLLCQVLLAKAAGNCNPIKSTYAYSLAPKITPAQSQVRWLTFTNRKIKRLQDALGSIHTFVACRVKSRTSTVTSEYHKVLLDDIKLVDWSTDHQYAGDAAVGPGSYTLDPSTDRLLVKTIDGAISVGRLKLQYYNFENASSFIKLLPKRSGGVKQSSFTTVTS